MSNMQNINVLLTEQARSVIAGVLRYPETWGRVTAIVGDLLVPKLMNASKWTCTAWLALTEVIEANVNVDALVLREKMQGLATLHRPELLSGWTVEDDQILRSVILLFDLVTSPLAVIDAAERFVTTFATHEFTRGLVEVQRELVRDPLADPFAAMSELQSQLQATCRRTSRVPLENAAEQTRAALAVSHPAVLATGFAFDELAGGGMDFSEITLLCARSGVGKSAMLQALARNQIFPHSAAPVRNVKDRLQVSTAPDRPYILGVWCENSKRMFYERLACDMLDIDSNDMRRDRQAALDRNNMDPERVHAETYINLLEQYGRLTVIDQDDLPNISPSAITTAIAMWIESVLAIDPNATMLVLVDYWQRTTPDQADLREQRAQQLTNAAMRFVEVIRNKRAALVLAAQVHDDFDNAEPERNGVRDSKGGINESGNVWLMHRWSNTQAKRIDECYSGVEARQRRQCASLLSDKGRNSAPGWRAVLTFDGAHYRFTDAPIPDGAKEPINWLRDRDTLATIKPEKIVKRSKDEGLTMGNSSAADSPFNQG